MVCDERGRGSLGDKCQLEVMDDPVDHGIIRNKSDELHVSTALGTNQRVDLVHFLDHLRPAPAGDSRALLLHDDEGMGVGLCLSHLAPVGVPAEAVISHSDLTLVGNMGEDLAVGNIQKKLLPHPLAPLLKPLGMARRTEAAGTAGEHQQPLLPTRGTPDAGKPAAGVAAVQIALDHLLDDRPEKTVLSLETGLIFLKELVKVMEEHPVEHGALWMSGTVNSCHSGGSCIKKRANPLKKGLLAEMTEVRQAV